MEDVNISKFRAQVVRAGSTPASPGFVVSEGQDPVNPSGSSNYVPYSGAIADVDLGEFGLETGFVNLDTTPTNIPTEQGAIYWDDARSTAALIMNGTLQHIGQDVFYYVKNSTGSSIPKGTAVRFDGTDGASGHLKIAPFLADGTYPSTYFMGVTAEEILNGEFGQVMHFGELDGINTSGYTAGALLYASTTVAGAFQTTAPIAPNNIVLIAAAINSTNNGTILVRPTYGSNINQDEGVKITTPTTGQLLQLQSNGLWENKTKAHILGGTSTQFVKGDGSLDSTSYQPLLTNPVTGTGTTNNLTKFTGASTVGNSTITDNGSIVSVLNSAYTDVFRVGSPSNSIYFYPDGGSVNIMTGAGFSGSGITFAGSSNYLDFNTNSLTRMRLSTAGNLLVGTTTDAGFKLDVNGTGRFVNNVSGGATNVLTITNAASTVVNTEARLFLSTVTGNDRGAYISAIITSASNDNALIFATNSAGSSPTEKVRITSSGNVGIGTTSPSDKLHIANNGTGAYSAALWTNSNSTANLYVGVGGSAVLNTGLQNNAYIINAAASGLAFGTSDAVRMFITSSGNVGIGTTAPTVLLQLNTADTVNNIFRITNGTQILNFGVNNSSGGSFIFESAAQALRFGTSDTERARITSGGNVLIGTSTSGGSKLRIVGLPTSSAGLSSGDVWNDSGTLKIA